MKNSFKLSNKVIIIVLMFSFLLSFANEGNPIKTKKDSNKIAFTLYSLEQGDILSVFNENGLKLYKEQIEKKEVNVKGINLTRLENGNYVFEVDKGLMISSIPFTVKERIVTFDEENERMIYKPHFRVKRKTVYLTQLTYEPGALDVNIYFKAGNNYKLVLSENIKNIKGLEKAYKLKNLKCGAYKIVVQDANGREFTKEIDQM